MVSSSGQMRLMEVEIRHCFVLSQRETLHALSVGRKDIWLAIVHLEERRRNGKLEKKQLEPRGIIIVIVGNRLRRNQRRGNQHASDYQMDTERVDYGDMDMEEFQGFDWEM